MAWSLLNHMIADKVSALLDEQTGACPQGVERFYSREQAEAIIHAALWGHASRSDGTAGAYAASNLFEALGIKFWSFDQDEAAAFQAIRQQRLSEEAVKRTAAPDSQGSPA